MQTIQSKWIPAREGSANAVVETVNRAHTVLKLGEARSIWLANLSREVRDLDLAPRAIWLIYRTRHSNMEIDGISAYRSDFVVSFQVKGIELEDLLDKLRKLLHKSEKKWPSQ